MRKLFIVFLMVLSLSACGPISPSYLEMTLNPGIDTIEVGSDYIDPGAKAIYGIRILSVVIIENTIDTETVGTYEIIYEATYQSIVKTIKRIVTVVDETPPVVTLNPGVDTITIGQSWVDEGIDTFDPSGEVDITVTGEVDTDTPGIYVITYVAQDIYENQVTVVRYVTVLSLP